MKAIFRVESISQVHEFLGLEKPKHPLVSVVPTGEHWKKVDITDHRFVIDLYQISLKTLPSGSFNYGRSSYDFQEGTLLFTAPGQVMEFDENVEELPEQAGWTLLFHPDLISKSSLGSEIDAFNFFGYEANEALHLSDEEKATIAEQVSKIEKEYANSIDRYSQELIIANIELLLKYCKRYYDRQFYTRTNLSKDSLSEFERVVKEYYSKELSMDYGVLTVEFCADRLNMSANYLGDLIKTETGKSANEHIHDHLIKRAKTKILSTSEPISQIAYSLGYEHPQSFNKLFKARVGATPSEFRKAG